MDYYGAELAGTREPLGAASVDCEEERLKQGIFPDLTALFFPDGLP